MIDIDCELRNIGIRIAGAEDVRFADVFWPMLKAEFSGRQRYGEDYAIVGRDGVHPGWAGGFVMVHARHLSRIQAAFQPVVHTIRIEEE